MGYYDTNTGQWVEQPPDYANPNQTPIQQPMPAAAPIGALGYAPAVPQTAPPEAPIISTPTQALTQQQLATMTPKQLALEAATTRTPGKAAVTQQQLDEAANTGTFVKQAESHAAVGGNSAAYADIQGIQDAKIEAAHQQSIADKLQANANLINAQAASKAAANRYDLEALAQQQKETAWQEQWDTLQQQMVPENNRVNPNRFFSNAGVIGSAMAIVGAALEAHGSTLGRQQNPQTLMRLIDNDIRSQQLEMMQRGQSANNQLNKLSQQWGSLEAGRQALRVVQLDTVNSQLKNAALRNSDPATKSAIDARTTQMDAQIADETAKLKAVYGGQESMQVQGAVLRPQKAQGGGTSVSAKQYLANLQTVGESAREERELDIKSEQQRHGTGEQSDQGRAERLGTKLAELQQVLKAQDSYNKSVGIEMNPKTGQLEQRGDHPLYGALDTTARSVLPTNAMSAKANDAIARRKILAETYGRAQSGAAISKEEREAFDEQIGGTSGANAASAANAFRESVLAKIQTLRSGSGQGATQIFDENARREAQRQQSINAVQPYQPKP